MAQRTASARWWLNDDGLSGFPASREARARRRGQRPEEAADECLRARWRRCMHRRHRRRGRHPRCGVKARWSRWGLGSDVVASWVAAAKGGVGDRARAPTAGSDGRRTDLAAHGRICRLDWGGEEKRLERKKEEKGERRREQGSRGVQRRKEEKKEKKERKEEKEKGKEGKKRR